MSVEVRRMDEEDVSDKLFLGSSDTDDYISSDEESTQAREDNSSSLLSYDVSAEPLNLCSGETKTMCNGAGEPGGIPCTDKVLEYIDNDLHDEESDSDNTGYDSSTNICFEEFDGVYSGYNSCDNSSHDELPNSSHNSDELLTKQESQNGKEDSQSTDNTVTNVERKLIICAKGDNTAIATDTELQKTDLYGCGSCGKQLNSKSGLRKHRCSQTAYTSTINAESSDDPEPEDTPPLKQPRWGRCDLKPHKSYPCQLCERSFSSQANCTRHMRNHTGDRPFSCQICGNTFKMESDVRLHMSCHSERTYSCDMCGKEFSRREYLKKHYRSHRDERREFECCICGKKIHGSITYMNHMKVHQGDRPHECPVCDESFTLSVDLQRHQAIHSGVDTHKCDHCEKVFLDKNHLITHIEADHKGWRSIPCTYCDKKFYHGGALTNHLKTHTSKTPFECQVCEKEFQSLNELQSHTRTHTEKQQSYTSILEEKATHYKIDDAHAENSINFDYKLDKSLSPRAYNSSKTVGVMVMKVDKEGNPAGAKVTVSGSGEDIQEQQDIGEKTVAGQDAVPSELSSVIVVKIKEEGKETNKTPSSSSHDHNTPRYTLLASHTPYNGVESSLTVNTITPLIPDDTSDLHDDLDQVVTLNTPEGLMYQCKVCGYQTRIKQSMLKHSRSHRGKKQSCRFCDMLFTDQYSLQHHYCTSHGEETFVSRGHDRVHNKHSPDPAPQKHRLVPQKPTSNGTPHNLPFQTKYGSHPLTQELLSRPVSSELSYRCEWCGKSYEKYQLYLDHCMTSHAQRKSYQCLKCHAKFSWRNSLHQHAKFCMNTEIEIYKCDQCPSEFKRKRDLKVHVEGKHGETEKLHTCSCGKTYKWQSGLARHRSKSGCSVEYVIHPSKFRA